MVAHAAKYADFFQMAAPDFTAAVQTQIKLHGAGLYGAGSNYN